MDSPELISRLAADGLGPEAMPSGPQLALLLDFANLYEASDLLHAPLCTSCVHHEDCWRTISPSDRPQSGRGWLTLPWIGPGYKEGGVAVLGMNLNDADGIAMAFRLANWEIPYLRRGEKRVLRHPGYRGSMFQYGSSRSAAILQDVIHGREVVDRASPEDHVGTLNSIVRLQGVKCSPTSTANGKPTSDMWRQCPPMLLTAELMLARPQYLLAFGRDNERAVARLPEYRAVTWTKSFAEGVLEIGPDLRVHVFFLAHPMRERLWTEGHRALLQAMLRTQALH